MTDLKTLIVAAQQGDSQAYSDIVVRFQDAVWAMAAARTQTAEQAHEVTQEVFLAAWLELPRLRHPEAFVRYLRWLSVKHADRALRRTAEALPGVLPEHGYTPPDQAAERQTRDHVVATVHNLPNGLRDVVALTYWADLTGPEVAQALDLSPGAVRKRLHTARKQLKEALMFDELKTQRPSADDRLALQIRLLVAARRGDATDAARVLQSDPTLVANPPALDLDDHKQYLLAGGPGGATALHFAAAGAHVGVSRVLVDAGIDVNHRARWGRTPLHHAIDADSDPVVTVLLEHGGDANALTDQGIAPLHLAAMRGRAGIVRALLEHGADPHVKGPEDMTPLGWAMQNRHFGCADLLAEAEGRDGRVWTGIKAIDLVAPPVRGAPPMWLAPALGWASWCWLRSCFIVFVTSTPSSSEAGAGWQILLTFRPPWPRSG